MIGASTEIQFHAEPRFGWHSIHTPLADSNNEDILIDYLTLRSYAVKKAGSRYQRYDLEIVNNNWAKEQYPRNEHIPLIEPGKYEVKSLYRAKPTHSFDRRFKAGSRGETIYGRRDAQIKALALDIENYLDHGMFPSGLLQVEDRKTSLDAMHELVDAALERRHSKSFVQEFTKWAEVYDDVWSLSSAETFLQGGIEGADIVRAFSDIDGIFIMAGAYFTLVNKDEFAEFFTFDSVSVEGVKLRYVGPIP